jgi:hypothetical protein
MLTRFRSTIEVLAWIVGILAVVGTGAYWLYENRRMIGIASSDIDIRPMASTREYMTFLAENTGNAPGSIGRVTGKFIFKRRDSESQITSADLRLDVKEYETGSVLIEPKKPQILRVYFANEQRLGTVLDFLADQGEGAKADCTFKFEIINHDRSQAEKSLNYPCEQYAAEYMRMRNKAIIRLPVPAPK